ncbi:hypothetical protein BDC45DRAFT_195666 [Circinella umbellata]|nr:hypothetical protein BDC45DRAFT_195666 [Circinella umbellata]
MISCLQKLLKDIKEIIFDEESFISSSQPQPSSQPPVVFNNDSNTTAKTNSQPVVITSNNLKKVEHQNKKSLSQHNDYDDHPDQKQKYISSYKKRKRVIDGNDNDNDSAYMSKSSPECEKKLKDDRNISMKTEKNNVKRNKNNIKEFDYYDGVEDESFLGTDDYNSKPMKNQQRRSYSSIASPSTYTQERQIVEGQCFHCPYKGCDMYQYTLGPLYTHIRKNHDSEFSRLQLRHKYIFKDEKGHLVLFDESSKNLLNNGDHLVVHYETICSDRILRKKKEVYCPYKTCKVQCSALHIMFYHIKTDHKVELPKIIEASKNETLMFKASSNGRLIDIFEEKKSRDKLSAGEQFTLVLSTILD